MIKIGSHKLWTFWMICWFFTIGCIPFQFQNLSQFYFHLVNPQVIPPTAWTNDHAIKDAWVYVNDEYQGSYPMTSTFPISDISSGQLTIYPGIHYYGLAARPEIYILMNPSIHTFQSKVLDTLTISPSFRYKTSVNLFLQDQFENNAFIFSKELDTSSQSRLIRSVNAPFAGKSSGLIELTGQGAIYESTSSILEVSPGCVKTLFLELNFKSSIDFTVGLQDPSTGQLNYFLTLLPSEEWKKVYIPLFEILNSTTIFRLAIKTSVHNGVSKGEVFIDNLRLLCLQ